MTRNEIKVELYKQKPSAFLVKIENGKWYYTAALKEPRQTLDFIVPVKDMGETVFKDEEPAQLLIRWLV